MQKQASKTLVMKFGGTSIGSARAMAAARQIVLDSRPRWARMVIVVSALAGVTDLLVQTASRAATGDLASLAADETWLRQSHETIARELIADPLRQEQTRQEIGHLVRSFSELCRAMAVLGEATPRGQDAVASLGERLSVRLLAAALEDAGIEARFVEATQLIVTDEHFQGAHPDTEATSRRTRAVLEPLFQKDIVPVVTGFIGATTQGVVTTLGRGGSDYSAAILGAVLPADEVWIWTDVDGVMTADPRLVPQARTLPEITYSELAELAYYGAKVLHPRTIRPVVEAGIRLRICNTFNPKLAGTRLVPNERTARKANGDQVIRAVTAIRKQRLITIEGRGMLGVPGVAARAFSAVASTGTSVPLITQASSEQSICFAVPEDAVARVLAALEASFAQELAQGDIDRVWATDEVAIITAVGTGARNTPGVAGKLFGQLGEAAINVLAIAHGSSDVSVSMVVDSDEAEAAVRALHELIVRGHAAEAARGGEPR